MISVPFRRVFHQTSALLGGTVVGGLCAYVYVVMGTRTVGADAFAPISVLWTFWTLSAAAITFPVMHWVIRTIEADGTEGRMRTALPGILAASVAVSGAFGGGTYLVRETLFSSDGALFPLLAAAIPFGSTAVGLARGTLAARRRFGATGMAIAAENLLRVFSAGVVIIAGGGTVGLAIALVVGFGSALLFPSALSFRGPYPAQQEIHPVAFIGAMSGGSLIGQAVLTGGPVALVALGGAPAHVTSLFGALAVFRAPYMISTGVATRITGALTRRVLDRRSREIGRLAWVTLAVAAVGAPAAAAFGAAVGPRLLRLVFGHDVALPAAVVAVVAAGSTLALLSLFTMLLLVASGRAATVTACWVVAAVTAAGLALVGPGDPLRRVAWAFLGGEAAALGTMLWAVGSLVRSLKAGRVPSVVEAAPIPPAT